MSRNRYLLAMTLVAAFAAAPVYLAAQSSTQKGTAPASLGAPAPASAQVFAPALRLERPGLPNLGKVSEQLYRGAQPAPEGFAELKKLGVNVVVNLRDEDSKIDGERKYVEAQGMKYVCLPWSGFARPNNKQVADFLQLLRDHPDQKVFVHCRRGAERTGVMVAAYRMSSEHWTPEQALVEMKEYRFRSFWFGRLSSYVKQFPSLSTTDPELKRVLTPAAQPAAVAAP